MPSLLLQPLIENAIKYAVSPREQGGTIRIGGHVTGGHAAARGVATTGPGMIDRDATRRTAAASASATRASDCRCCTAIAGIVSVHNTEAGIAGRIDVSGRARRRTCLTTRDSA